MKNQLSSEAPRGEPRGISGAAKRNCAVALTELGQANNPASPRLRRGRHAIHPRGKFTRRRRRHRRPGPRGILAKANKVPAGAFKNPPGKLTFESVADKDHIGEIMDFVERALDELVVKDDSRGNICVSVDEAITNVVSYAYPNSTGTIKISLERINNSISVEIIDSGAPFNPLNHPVPDVSASIEKRLIGGLGIHLMRNMLDELNYRRIGDKNCLSLVKHIGEKK